MRHMCGVYVPMSSAFRPVRDVGQLVPTFEYPRRHCSPKPQGTQVQQGTGAQTEHMCFDESWNTREVSSEPHRQRHFDC